MIFTIGKTELYEEYFRTIPNLEKAKGGSVWEAREEAQQFANRHRDAGGAVVYSVYGVEADWDKDTEQGFNDDGAECYFRPLNRDARLVRL